MGGRDKGAVTFHGRILSDIALGRLSEDTERVVVAAPSRPAWLGGHEHIAFVSDQVDLDGEPVGPAGGLLAALLWAHDHAGRNALVYTMPVDAPFAPSTLCDELIGHLGEAPAVIVQKDGRLHPIFGVWRASLAMALYDLVMDHGQRALKVICNQIGANVMESSAPESAFLNINTEDDLKAAEAFAGGDQS